MKKWPLGTVIELATPVERVVDKVLGFGLHNCQLTSWRAELWSAELAADVKRSFERAGITISTLWVGTPGRMVWNMVEGPLSIGLVPPATRAERLEVLKRGLGFRSADRRAEHHDPVGFIPENPSDPLYQDVLAALRELVFHCRGNEQEFWFETGQETPVTLLRTIEDLGVDNLGVNFDPANLLMYGRGNPVDAVGLLGPYIRGVHAKDGEYPAGGRTMGVETRIGYGRVDFPALFERLKLAGFDGDIAIEREITGEQQQVDIRQSIGVLVGYLATVFGE